MGHKVARVRRACDTSAVGDMEEGKGTVGQCPYYRSSPASVISSTPLLGRDCGAPVLQTGRLYGCSHVDVRRGQSLPPSLMMRSYAWWRHMMGESAWHKPALSGKMLELMRADGWAWDQQQRAFAIWLGPRHAETATEWC